MGGTTQTATESASFNVRLPCRTGSVPEARGRVRRWCQGLGVRRDLAADIQLAVTEAAGNAVRHSGCDEFEIRGWVSDLALNVCVWDEGNGLPAPDPGAGLGIGIIRALAGSVEFEDTRPGTRVTMRFPAG
jgi:anti-sigma regulatory factor (Ser/Thr protein kinase)